MQRKRKMQNFELLEQYDGIYTNNVEVENNETDSAFGQNKTTDSMLVPSEFEYENEDGEEIAVTLEGKTELENGEEGLKYIFHNLDQAQTEGNPFRQVAEAEISVREANDYLTQSKEALAESYDDLLE